MRHSLPIVVVLACVVFLAGCGEDRGKRHLTRTVNLPEILGVWEMTKASQDLLKRDGYVEIADQPYTITFNNDGSLKFTSVLDDVRGGTFTNCLGKWKLDHDRTVDDETPRANVVELQLLRPTDRYFRKFALTEVDEQLRLWNYYGDADAREYIEYERPGASAKPTGF